MSALTKIWLLQAEAFAPRASSTMAQILLLTAKPEEVQLWAAAALLACHKKLQLGNWDRKTSNP
jgi:hypothetical protein